MTQIGEAFVRVRPDTRGFAGETKRGVTRGLRSAAGIAGVSLGVAAVVSQIREATKAAKEAETIQLQAANAVKAAGQSWEQYGAQIEAAANQQAKLQAFDDEEVVVGFSRIVRNVKDVRRSLDLTALAGDLATARMTNGQRDLAGAAQIVAKVAGGNVGILRRYGISLKEGASASEALAALQQKVGGAAAAFASGTEGAQAKLNKVFGDTQEIVGGALLPTITDLSNRLGAYLSNANETGETQRRVNEAMEVTGKVVRGVSTGIDLIRTVTGPAIDAVGGVENAVKFLVTAFAVGKVVKFAGAVRGVAATFLTVIASSRRATAAVVADSAVAGRALDVAYRPRNIVVTGGGVGAGGTVAPSTARGTKLPGTTGTRGGGLVGIAGIVAATVGISALTQPPSLRDQQLKVADVARVDKDSARRLAARFASEYGTKIKLLTIENPFLKRDNIVIDGPVKRIPPTAPTSSIRSRPDEGTRGPGTSTTGAATRRVNPNRRLTFKQVEGRLAGFDEQQTDARIKGSVAAERKALVAEQRFLQEQLRDTKRSAEQRRRLKDELLATVGSIESIDDAASQARKEISDRGVAKAKERERAADKRKAAQERANKAERSAAEKVFERDLREAGVSSAAHITGIITGRDVNRTGVFATGGRAPTSTASGSRGVTGSVNTITIDQLLRDIAQGQAQRDRLQLDQATETNRLLRIIAPGNQNAPATRRGRTPGAPPSTARDTADVTGGLP